MLTRAPIAVLLVAVLLLCAAPTTMAAGLELGETAVSDIPSREEVATNIWFQGFIADSSTGEPVTATYDIMAEIYNAAGSGELIWGPENHPATSIVDGWFNIELGHYIAMMYFDSPPYYLELTVNGEVLVPRLKLGSSPSALISQKAVEDDGDWGISGDNVHRMTGNVGIGTSTPTERFEVYASHDTAIRGKSSGESGSFYGVVGEGWGDGTTYGVIGYGYGAGSVYGVAGFGDYIGVAGHNNAVSTWGSLGTPSSGVVGSSGGMPGLWAGYFEGNVHVTDSVGIGTETPSAELDVLGIAEVYGLRMETGANEGYLLTCDAGGNASWEAPGAVSDDGDWTIAGGDMYSNATGKVAVGTTSPTSPFTVYSDGSNALESTSENPGGASVAIRGNASGNESYGLYGDAHADNGVCYGVRAESHADRGTAYGCYAAANTDSGSVVGVFSEATVGPVYGASATGVYGRALLPANTSTGVKGEGGTWGVWGGNSSSTAKGRLGGQDTGVYGDDGSGQADWAGYFEGDVYLQGDVHAVGAIGVLTDSPRKPIHVYTNYGGVVTYGIEVENFAEDAGSATGILFKVGSSNEDRGKGAIVYERTSTWNRGSFHILQDSGVNPNVANLGDAVVTVENSGDVGIGTTTPASKLEVAGMVHSTSGGFKFPDGSIQATASLAPPTPARAAGNVVLDASGEAAVPLPASLSDGELLYQLTCIGGYAPVYVAEKAEGGTFTIAGGQPGMEVSWQVTAE